MRITSGELKGREISLPSKSRVRPATSFVREMAMSIFTPERLAAAPFADICAGSGLMGFEALSRGAPQVLFVESHRPTLAQIRENARRFEMEERCAFIGVDARRCGTALRSVLDGRLIGAAFADPPFIKGMAQEVLVGLARASAVFESDALIILRCEDELRQPPLGLKILERRPAGHGICWLLQPV